MCSFNSWQHWGGEPSLHPGAGYGVAPVWCMFVDRFVSQRNPPNKLVVASCDSHVQYCCFGRNYWALNTSPVRRKLHYVANCLGCRTEVLSQTDLEAMEHHYRWTHTKPHIQPDAYRPGSNNIAWLAIVTSSWPCSAYNVNVQNVVLISTMLYAIYLQWIHIWMDSLFNGLARHSFIQTDEVHAPYFSLGKSVNECTI